MLGPTSMENKKRNIQNATTIPNNEIPQNEANPKNLHLRTAPPQQMRMLQYGLNYQNLQFNQCHSHEQLKHIHMHQQLPLRTAAYQHYQTSPSVDYSSIKYQQQYYHHQHLLPQLINNPLNHQSLGHYQINQTPALHPHAIGSQKGPDIWVPQQNPSFVNQNNKIDNVKKYSKEKILEVKTTAKENIEKKKSFTQLRSPSAKRPLESPVTIQGWLYKQGSDGLMLWKKRWFVLSEFCLFYYKSSEEEKLLGSILLPSYKVSMCGSDDKVNKKYAFKCEHTNMRTYILAADTNDIMLQWIRLLNLACNLQNNLESESQVEIAAISSTYSRENSVSGFSQQNTKCSVSPLHIHSSSNVTDMSNPTQQEFSQYSQPLYANAPPKPRRLTNQSSPSLDVLEQHRDIIKYTPKSPLNSYGHVHYQPPSPDCNHMHDHIIAPEHQAEVVHNIERRTPDTYGRSKQNSSRGHPTDYEDIYTDQTIYKRPLSPLAYSHVKASNHFVNMPYKMYQTSSNLPDFRDSNEHVKTLHQHQTVTPFSIQRPHSADFLEYELNHCQPNNSVLSAQQPRPKSSLDINRRTNDSANYYYSEERYAQNMRKSTQYLPRISKHVNTESKPNIYTTNKKNLVLGTQNPQMNNFTLAPEDKDNDKTQSVRCRSVLSEGSLPQEIDIDLIPNCSQEKGIFLYGSKRDYYLIDDVRNSECGDSFLRSVSARLTQNMLPGEKIITREGERKREESMKRLLEWKQKMLQSPLNRKVQNYKLYSGKMALKDCVLRNVELQMMHNGNHSVTNLSQYNSYSSDDEASGSISINTRDAFSKTLPTKSIWPSNLQPPQSRSVLSLTRENDHENSVSSQQSYLSTQDFNHHDYGHKAKKDTWLLNDKVNDVSAGELLGRTHEELVLLLIQLRRQSSNTLQAIENAYNEIDMIQAQVHGSMLNQAKRLESLQKLEQIRQNLLELEKQYEKGKPLVNLVDNMVKLGSLYRYPNECYLTPDMRNRLEFNQHVQERRLLAEERRDWNRLNPNYLQLQEKVQQLYKLDKLIQEESGTLQILQQDKEDIERALCGLRYRLNKGFTDPTEIDEARKQQANLENELSKVLLMLAQNSKKLEETVAGNARLEQELLILKQKLQISRQQRTSPQFSNAGDSLSCAMGTSAILESDLQRVQQKVGDLQKQRQEICMQVRQLTDRSQNLQQQIKSSGATLLQNNQGVNNKKKTNSLWRETDLDTMSIVDHGDCYQRSNNTTPVYVSTDSRQLEYDFYDPTSKCGEYDEQTQSPLLTFQEKQEIKTVRIVKRESERRQRDREKITISGKWDLVTEEESLNMKDLYKPVQKSQSFASVASLNLEPKSNVFLNKQSSLSNSNLPQPNSETDKITEMLPVFKSEAAKEIINEMSVQEGIRHTNRRAIPREKRRHHTAPHNNIILRNFTLLPSNNNFDKVIYNDRRARDDLDMERALRQRIDAPDVVRSTLSNKELKYNESTIDNILGTPNKISIPERYIPEELPQLTAEEQEQRLKKVESIKKMLSDASINSSSTLNLIADEKQINKAPTDITNKVTTKMIEEKKQREHLLHLKQILAQQVMEMSKIVAGTTKPDDE